MEWFNFKEKKPKAGQVCLVSTGPDNLIQYLALIWDGKDFIWADDEFYDPFPTEEANKWALFPEDPIGD